MQATFRRAAFTLAGAAALQGFAAQAQESLRNSLEYQNINRQRQNNIEKQYYNVKAGPLRFTASAGASVTYNDNLNASETNPQDDFIIQPSLTIGAMWQITEYNRLALDTQVGYAKYINHDEYDRLTISPGSTSDISYDLLVGSVRFNIHDRLHYQQDPTEHGTVTDEADLGRIRNTAGVAVTIPLKDMQFMAGFDHVNYKFLNNSFRNSSYASEMFFVRGAYQVNSALATGVEASAGFTSYEQGLRSDNRNYTAGPFINWRLTAHMEFEARAGVSTYELASTGTLGDASAPLSYYASVNLNHQINQRIVHSIMLGRDTMQGVGFAANFNETMYARHQATWRVIKNVSLSTHLFYEYSESEGRINFFGFQFFFNESYSRYGGGLTLGYQLMEQMHTVLRFMHTIREGGRVDYSQNLVTLAVGYRF